MKSKKQLLAALAIVAVGLPFVLPETAFAAPADVTQVENFIRDIIKIVAGLAGLVATAFFVVGGFGYITSSGNPEHLDRAKRTLLWSGIGLAIVIAAFVISNIIVSIATNSFGS
ncbi:MAG: pilin [Candidatus Microsaccharimonas sp.]